MSKTKGWAGERLIVLLAEDDQNEATLIRQALEGLGLAERVIRLANGEETIACLHGTGRYADRDRFPNPDLLFLDYRMPRLSGLGVLCWLRSEPRFQHLPVVILTEAACRSHFEMATRMHAACCPKRADGCLTPRAIETSVRKAFQMVKPRTDDYSEGTENRNSALFLTAAN